METARKSGRQLGGVGATYMTITSGGVITLPSNFVSVQLSLEGVSFRQTN
jgi:hypothetical protein